MPAIGAVRPTAIIRCTKGRRDNWPAFTSAIRFRSLRSFIDRLLAAAELPPLLRNRCERKWIRLAPSCQSRIRANSAAPDEGSIREPISGSVADDQRHFRRRRVIAAALGAHDSVDDGHADAGQVTELDALQDILAR